MNNKFFDRKEWTRPFEIKPFFTEWDYWCEHKLSIFNKKFKPMPIMCPVLEAGELQWHWDQKIVNQTIEKNPVIQLVDGANRYQVQQIYDAFARTQRPGIIISQSLLETTMLKVPDNVRVITAQPLAYQFSKTFVDSGIRPVYHRQVKDLDYPFMIMSYSNDFGRTRLMLMLKQIGILNDSLYSSSGIRARDNLFEDDAININHSLEDIPTRVLGESYIKFDVKKNLELLPGLLNLCHFYVGVGVDGLYKEQRFGSPDEKHFWGYTGTVPTLPIWGDAVTCQMQKWGYRFDNIDYRREEETVQDTVIRWCKEILFHYQITQNEQWSQSWQDSQGEITIHNFELTRRLHQIILEDVERQIAELPQEFQNLQ